MRYISKEISGLLGEEKRMAFIAGPRQVGKTTLARHLLTESNAARWYFSWDIPEHRKVMTQRPTDFWLTEGIPEQGTSPRICLDEIHKHPRWKNFLKGLFDAWEKKVEIIVTGSGRLDIYKRGGDSLFGRYSMYHLYPFTVAELLLPDRLAILPPDDFFQRGMTSDWTMEKEETLRLIDKFSGFPEPLFAAEELRVNRWRREHETLLLREDVRDLTHVRDLGSLEALGVLLRERIGSPLSLNALAEDISVTHVSVRNWIDLLRRIFYLFELKPWVGALARSLKKSSKVYLFDHSSISNEGARFENLMALHLHTYCTAWTDFGYGDFSLHYVRDREGRECDFLVTKGRKPYALIETKLSAANLDRALLYFQERLRPRYTFQITREQGKKDIPIMESGIVLTSAAGFLGSILQRS